MKLRDEQWWKGITPASLMRLLPQVSADHVLVPNEVGNLAILNADEQYVGYLDVLNEEVVYVEGSDPGGR